MKRWEKNDLYDIPGFRFHTCHGRLASGSWKERNPEFGRLVLVRNGTAVHTCEQGLFPVSTGDVFYIFPGSEHGFRNISNLEYFDILFDHSMFLHPHPELLRLPGYRALFHDGPKRQSNHQLSSRLRLNGPPLNRALDLIAALRAEYEHRYPACEAVIRSQLVLLITHLARQYAEQRLACSSTAIGIARAATYIEINYRENILLNDIVGAACMSRSSFMRAFRELYQMSPLKYLNEIRLRKAAFLLKCDTASITEIAFRVGFSDPNYFSRMFRRYYGKSPREYRNRMESQTAESP